MRSDYHLTNSPELENTETRGAVPVANANGKESNLASSDNLDIEIGEDQPDDKSMLSDLRSLLRSLDLTGKDRSSRFVPPNTHTVMLPFYLGPV